MNPATRHVLQFFRWDHLREPLQSIALRYWDLAWAVAVLGDNPETTVALRKLLESRDAALRSQELGL